MTAKHIVIIAVVLAAVQIAVVTHAPKPPSTRFALRTDTWKRVQSSAEYYGWYVRNLRCSKATFDSIVERIIPMGTFFLADAGYKLFQHMMTPFEIRHGMPQDEAHYNYIHSRTRTLVERAFGLWKNKFRMFKSPLDHHTPQEMARLIETNMILHNWIIDLEPTFCDEDNPSKNFSTKLSGCTLVVTSLD
ncbi:hypothetical protein H257_16188 [Aphanomyces astaci]|uniref:DDE Tnp4 domain-containing protein n=1 Tax=Aphanomyces astaci TaxID=112090 RepID=W4FLB0_APHAT|nr:hypothetical protein H257_16188 [Aphanomyces astaci]ETV67589.1 hypothetical protein H257_16188 [Aphanomyces astaci]|eukprot:XP_009842846.1 hypothetical protein H257_16188 [Aphanomyces astaci]